MNLILNLIKTVEALEERLTVRNVTYKHQHPSWDLQTRTEYLRGSWKLSMCLQSMKAAIRELKHYMLEADEV